MPSAAQPPLDAKPDHGINYDTWQQMLLSLIALSVCGKTRDRRRGTGWTTQKHVINAAGAAGKGLGQEPLADQLYEWKKAVEEQLKTEVHGLSRSKAAAWHAWLKGLQTRVYETSCSWEHQGSPEEGIRQAARVIVSHPL